MIDDYGIINRKDNQTNYNQVKYKFQTDKNIFKEINQSIHKDIYIFNVGIYVFIIYNMNLPKLYNDRGASEGLDWRRGRQMCKKAKSLPSIGNWWIIFTTLKK